MLRVTTGISKNKRLKIPETPEFRAVQEIAKSALFSIIGDKVKNAECLDLFAGSGNLGIEALSRGAKGCDFVDNVYESFKTIEENLIKCGSSENSEIFFRDASKFVVNTEKKYDLVFADPYYNDTSQAHLLKNLEKVLKKDGLAAFFHGKELMIESLIHGTNLKVVTQRKFGATHLTLLKNEATGVLDGQRLV